MSSFMSKCEGCGYLIPKVSTCPNCQHSKDCETQDGEKSVDVVETFAERRASHNRNSTIIMGLKMALGFFALLASGGVFFARAARGASRSLHRLEPLGSEVESASSFSGLLTVGLIFLVLFVCGIIYHWLSENADSLLPTELCCPQCDERLDKLNVEYDKCPSCFVQLT